MVILAPQASIVIGSSSLCLSPTVINAIQPTFEQFCSIIILSPILSRLSVIAIVITYPMITLHLRAVESAFSLSY